MTKITTLTGVTSYLTIPVNEKEQLPPVYGSISEDMSNSILETITKIISTIFLVRDFRNIYAVVGVQLKDFSIMEYYTNNRI